MTGPAEDLEDLYEHAPFGYVSLTPDGRIFKANATLAGWTGYAADELPGMRLSNLLGIAGRIFYETHVAPLLRMQHFFHEFALDMSTKGGDRLPVIANAVEKLDGDGQLLFTRIAIFKAADRRLYERELLKARELADRAKKESQELYASAREVLESERAISELREQFIAVLGHDLRNPLASLSAGARLMLKVTTPDEAAKLEKMMQSSVERMSKLIDSVMDFARGRLGGGISLSDRSMTDLKPVIDQVIAELVSDHPDRIIEAEIKLTQLVFCDRSRIAQMFSNLLGNAITHGDPAQPIRVQAATFASSFELYVANSGEQISPEAMAKLFQPFQRGDVRPSKQGLGLGLYIASEIAKAHGGALDVTSDDSETRFTFIMPINPDADAV
jgi:sigma-B regulation protein RsbU (phosphoserine phosphatase)